jgi:hypothetical protein
MNQKRDQMRKRRLGNNSNVKISCITVRQCTWESGEIETTPIRRPKKSLLTRGKPDSIQIDFLPPFGTPTSLQGCKQ